MHNFKKQFGQNFISDKGLIDGIVGDAKINKDDIIIEIGAGLGSLTKELAKCARFVYSFEIDKDLIGELSKLEEQYDNLKFIFEDFMAFNFDSLKINKFKVVANLPYYLTSPIIERFLVLKPESMTIMVQKEVAERLSSEPDNSEFGAMSVIIQHQASVKITRIVDKKMFTPVPKVDSAVIHIEFNGKNYDQGFAKFVYSCFTFKRKTLYNNLTKSAKLDQELIEKIYDNYRYYRNRLRSNSQRARFYQY
ncbi:MAG: 16S rRNA (adenine(1518)-N(6)/adenine(1519)-N(6))-dimethyltransferase RsmA [bacterium]|nr:16S rRNA (adenine(1518)-N(6)/adenine(1519)-N(6))-dimethyltransferase RsmA [bacterium]